MPQRPTADPKQVIQATPTIQVNDPQETATYYRDKLGFDFDFSLDYYAVVWRDNAAIHFLKSEEPASGIKIFLWVKDADEVLAEFKEKGVDITVDIGDRDYGVRDFSITDCNGLELNIGSDIE